ncbi:hypothetical protein [Kribbella antibiotica]|nr:hypothetical protein [Kribbella antibiotica]
MPVLERLGVWSGADPVAEIDVALAIVVVRLSAARKCGRAAAAAELLAWMDVCLEERLSLQRDQDLARGSTQTRSPRSRDPIDARPVATQNPSHRGDDGNP